MLWRTLPRAQAHAAGKAHRELRACRALLARRPVHTLTMMPSLQMRQSNIVKPKSEKVRVPTRGRARCRRAARCRMSRALLRACRALLARRPVHTLTQ